MSANEFHTKVVLFFFSSSRRHTRFKCDWSSDVCPSDLSAFSLNQTESRAFYYTTTPSDNVTNIATAQGQDPCDVAVGPVDDSASVTVSTYPGASLDIAKTVSTDNSTWVENIDICSGSTAYWQVIVTNDGDCTVDDINVSDNSTFDFGSAFSLNQTESRAFYYTTNPSDNVTNIAIAQGQDPCDVAVGPEDDSASVTITTYPGASLDIAKTVSTDNSTWVENIDICSGITAYWQVIVTNDGDCTVSNINVSDNSTFDFGSAFSLNQTESRAFYYTTNPTDNVTNTATAQGQDPCGVTVGPEDDRASVTITTYPGASLDIAKTVSTDNSTWLEKIDIYR